MNRHMKKNQAGFTLIEIAIVMVIIGLLLGGVLKGQSMINSAKVRSLNNSVDGISAAWFAFQDRYRAMPGDMVTAVAVAQISNAITVGAITSNGLIDTGLEQGALWVHLAAAGFISGNYNGAVPTNVYSCIVATCPDNRFGLGFMIANSAISFTSAKNRMYTGSNIPVEIIAELDRKIDDGIPTTGSVHGGINNGAQAGCVTGTGLTATYNMVTPNADCGLGLDNI